MRLLTAIGAAVLTAAAGAHAQVPAFLINQLAPPGVASSPLETRAQQVERLAENHVRLTGDVEFHGGSWQLSADQVDIFTDESRLVATGNVVFISADGRIAAERVEFDTDTETGTFYNVALTGGGPPNP
jgi:lipopolysaccharide assembly outer membrane protein LptD (OstA)